MTCDALLSRGQRFEILAPGAGGSMKLEISPAPGDFLDTFDRDGGFKDHAVVLSAPWGAPRELRVTVYLQVAMKYRTIFRKNGRWNYAIHPRELRDV